MLEAHNLLAACTMSSCCNASKVYIQGDPSNVADVLPHMIHTLDFHVSYVGTDFLIFLVSNGERAWSPHVWFDN